MAAASAVCFIAIAVLALGWVLGVDAVLRLAPSYAAMAPSTALCFLLSGAAVLIHPDGFAAGSAVRRLRLGAAVLLALPAAANLIVAASGVAEGLDYLLWPVRALQARGVMAPVTAVGFLLVSGGLALGALEASAAFVVCATAGACLSIVALLGYLFGAEGLYEIPVFTAMALHTALCFAALFMALLLMRPREGWVGLLLGEGAGSAAARRRLPVAVGAPLGLCFAVLVMAEQEVLNDNFRLALLALAMMLVTSTLLLRDAAIDNRVERRLIDTMRQLQRALEDRELLLDEVYHRVRNNLQQVDALILIQSSRLTDRVARDALAAISGRIRALTTVHRMLVPGQSATRLRIDAFLTTLCENIRAGHGAALGDVRISVEAPPLEVDIDFATSLGLLTNELVANALKHAFPDRRSGEIRVVFRCDPDGGSQLVVADDGRGLPDQPPEPVAGGGVGFRIVQGLTRQLGGQCDMHGQDGLTVTVTMPPAAMKRGLDD